MESREKLTERILDLCERGKAAIEHECDECPKTDCTRCDTPADSALLDETADEAKREGFDPTCHTYVAGIVKDYCAKECRRCRAAKADASCETCQTSKDVVAAQEYLSAVGEGVHNG